MALPVVAVKVIIDMQMKNLRKKVRATRKTWLQESAKLVQKDAKASIKRRKVSSDPGNPPYSKTGNYRRSIRYKVGRANAWIGPTRPLGSHGNLLEQGSRLMEPRPVMGPALERARPKIRRFRKL